MTVKISNKYGKIDVSTDAIATLAGVATTECYGVVGMVSRNHVKDGIASILRRENYSKGIEITQSEDKIDVYLHVVISYGVKITEVCLEIQKKVKYEIEKALEGIVSTVNVEVKEIKTIDNIK